MANKTLEELLQSSSVEDMYETAQLYVREIMKHGENSDIYGNIVGHIGLRYGLKYGAENQAPFSAYTVVIAAVGAGKTLDEVKGLLGWLGFKEIEE